MGRLFYSLLLTLLVATPAAADELDDLLGQPPESIDPVAAALIVAGLVEPDVDRAGVERTLARAAQTLRQDLQTSSTPEARLDALRRAVHATLGLEVDDVPPREQSLEGVFPHHVLVRRRGACLGLSLIYLSLAKRAGLPLAGVSLPGHFFVRHRAGEASWNLETTLKGIERSDDWYRETKGLSAEGEVGNYLQDLTPREVVAEVLNNVGGAFVRLKEPRRALPFLRRACQLAPADPDAHYNLAIALRDADSALAALESVERSLRLFPDSCEALNLRGLLRLDEDALKSLLDFDRAVQLRPEEARYRNNRGTARCRLTDVEGGLTDFTRALELRPGWGEARLNQALALLELGKVPEAVATVERHPDERVPWRELFHRLPQTAAVGRSLLELANRLRSRRDAGLAASLEAGDRLLGGQDPSGARRAYDRALSFDAGNVEAYCKRGLACERTGDELWAKRNYYLAMQSDTQHPLGYQYMGHYYLRRDDYVVAADYFRKYLERAPREAPDRAEIQELVQEIERGFR